MRALLVTVLLVCSLATVAAAQQAPPWTVEQMSADLDQLAAAVREEWSYYEDRTEHWDLDLAALVAAAKDRLGGVESEADFKGVLELLVAGLKDGHASVRVPGVFAPLRRWPVLLAVCGEGEVVITAVAAPGEGADAGALRPVRGDRLLRVNGDDIGRLLELAHRRTFGSTASGRAYQAIRHVRRTRADTVTLAWRTADGGEVEAELPTIGYADLPAGTEENWALSWPREDVALLRITKFSIDDWQRWTEAKVEERDEVLRETREKIDAVFADLSQRSARALILDLRGNGGGTDLLGIHVAKHLLAEPFVYMKLSAKLSGRWTDPHGYTYRTDPHMKRFDGPVVALIDGGCFSTTDNFLRCLDDEHPRFTAVGRPTGGGTGAPRPIAKLTHSGAEVTLCTHRVSGSAGELIEGRGTTPDVPVTPSCDDLASGADPDLEAALTSLPSPRPR